MDDGPASFDGSGTVAGGPPDPIASGPRTVAELRRAGVADHALRGPTLVRVFHGVCAHAPVAATLHGRAEAVLLVAPPGAVVARHTAARLWGGVVPEVSEVHLTLAPGTRLRLVGVDARVRVVTVSTRRGGLLDTTPAQTLVDLVGQLGLVDLVVLGDSLVRAGVVTPDALVRAAEGVRGRRGRLARRAAGLVRAGVDSPMETRLRMLLVVAGLPEPVVNVAIREDGGRVICRLDLGYPEVRVAVEYDGRQHAENTAQWQWDVRRREELEGDGWRLVVVQAGDLYREPARTLAPVVAALGDRGLRLRVRGSEWVRHVPGPSAG